MTVVAYPLDAVTGAPSYTGRMLRQSMASMLGFAPNGRPLGAISGVRRGTNQTTTCAATSTTWTVNPHAGVLDLESSAIAGAYAYAVTVAETGSVTAANATNPRIDILYAKINDPAESDGSSTPAVVIGYLAGTAASSPSPPATPARSMVLAQVTVPASGGGAPTVAWVAPVFGAAPHIQVAQANSSTSVTAGTGGFTALSSGMVIQSQGGITGATISSGTFTVPTGHGGLWKVSSMVGLTTPAGITSIGGAVQVNGLKVISLTSAASAVLAQQGVALPDFELTLNDGDTVGLGAQVTGANATTVSGSSYQSFYRLERIS